MTLYSGPETDDWVSLMLFRVTFLYIFFMQQLEERQQSLKTADIKYAEVKLWLDNFERYINDGSILNMDDSTVLKQLVDQIVVGDAGIEIQFKCGVMLKKEYE